MFRTVRGMALAIAFLAPLPAVAQDAPDRPIDAETRADVIEALGESLEDGYVFPEVAASLSAELEAKLASGAYDSHTTARPFARALADDMRTIGKDRHFGMRFEPDREANAPRPSGPPDEAEIAEMQLRVARNGYGLARIERLPGNIGYLDIRGFLPSRFIPPAYEAAMKLLEGSDAIIIDLRSNGGGDPKSVTQLMSHLYPVGTSLLVNTIYNRPRDHTEEFWIDQTVETRFTGPVFVITSGYTFSGGEEFAYDIKTHGRGKLIGEQTGGGANPTASMPIGGGFVASIPTGRAINPITGTNWEGVGVTPDRIVPATDAANAAYIEALEAVRDTSDDETAKGHLMEVIDDVRSGELALPGWEDPRAARSQP